MDKIDATPTEHALDTWLSWIIDFYKETEREAEGMHIALSPLGDVPPSYRKAFLKLLASDGNKIVKKLITRGYDMGTLPWE